MSQDLDETFTCLHDSKVPPLWQKAYPTLKPLAPWIHDLIQRIDQMRTWAEGTVPTVFWLGGFTFPTGFLTALMQMAARKNNIPIDSLTWEFVVLKDALPAQPPEEGGAYISGMYLEGARWDYLRGCLVEPNPMELYAPMPVVYFKPVETKKKIARDPKEICIFSNLTLLLMVWIFVLVIYTL